MIPKNSSISLVNSLFFPPCRPGINLSLTHLQQFAMMLPLVLYGSHGKRVEVTEGDLPKKKRMYSVEDLFHEVIEGDVRLQKRRPRRIHLGESVY